MKAYYFNYGNEVISCILVGSKKRILSRAIAIWDGNEIMPFNEEEGKKIAFKRAKRALKRNYMADTYIMKDEAILRMQQCEAHEIGSFPPYRKAIVFHQSYDNYIYDYFTSKENEFFEKGEF